MCPLDMGIFSTPDIFLWKILRHALPVDTRVQSRGIQVVSGCRCCTARSEESIVHLFLSSQVSRQVWNYFAKTFHLPSGYNSILQVLNILREIWVARCKATYDEGNMNVPNICNRVTNRLCTLSLVISPHRGSTALQSVSIEQLRVAIQPTRSKKGLWCKWDHPSPGWFKLNADGSARGSIACGCRVIRSNQGELSLRSMERVQII